MPSSSPPPPPLVAVAVRRTLEEEEEASVPKRAMKRGLKGRDSPSLLVYIKEYN